jgi:hypothetical protein
MLERAKQSKQRAKITRVERCTGTAKRHGSAARRVPSADTPHGICPNQAFQHLSDVERGIDVLDQGGERGGRTAQWQSKRITASVDVKGISEPQRQYMADIDQLARGAAVVLGRITRNMQPCPPEGSLDSSLRHTPPDQYPHETLHGLIHCRVERIVRSAAL